MSAGAGIRLVSRDDEAALYQLFAALSPESVYRRFFTLYSHPPMNVIRALTRLDHDRRDAAVAFVGDEVVGVAQYALVPGTVDTAEVAVVVADAWQGGGLGRRLLAFVTSLARLHGMTTLTATVLAENRPAIAMLHAAYPDAIWVPNGAEYDLTISLASWRKTA